MALTRHVGIVTGANHGIGAATARRLAADSVAVLLGFFGEPDPSPVLEAIHNAGGRADAVHADLRDPETPARLFDVAEAAFGPVDVLVNNASAGGQDSFRGDERDRIGRALQRVSVASASAPLDVDARGSALLIAEFARRHIARDAT